jgi:hypothetical protein
MSDKEERSFEEELGEQIAIYGSYFKDYELRTLYRFMAMVTGK